MNTHPTRSRLALVIAALCLACAGPAEEPSAVSPEAAGTSEVALQEVATLPGLQITGVAVAPSGRRFVNVPFWPGQDRTRVLELLPDGATRPYPSEEWHGWTAEGGGSPEEQFVCVQSVWADDRGRLWILDPASPSLAGVVAGGAKLLEVDLKTDTVSRVYRFDETVAPANSYLNDVRVDSARGVAYLTDSGAGALVVLDLATGTARRLLADHPSTSAEDLVVTIGDWELRGPDGAPLQVHSDGIALDSEGGWLYWHALTGRRLYRASAEILADPEVSPEALAAAVEDLGETVVTDGLLFHQGGVVHTALEQSALVRWSPEGGLETIVEDPRLAWPDSLAAGPGGDLYVTTSQIHLSPLGGATGQPAEPYRVWRVAR